jgi:hypothetical protein
LQKDDTLRKFGVSEFSTKPTNFYSLDVIISVGYRVKSVRGTQFRIWANSILKEYLIKGFALNDEQLKAASRISYKRAAAKADEEYDKYKNIIDADQTPVEKAFLENMKLLEDKVKK